MVAIGQNLPPIEHNFLGLTGGAKGIQGINRTPVQYTGGLGAESGAVSGRALDKAPKAQKFDYQEYLPAQAGYENGQSKWSLIA